MENHRILIVEDDEAIAGAVSRIIESWGLTPRCVRDFRDVLREFTDFDPHLVLMDITMPNMDGLEALKAIRAKDSSANVVMCSAMGQEAMVMEAVQAGIKDFIVKPFKDDRLMKTVNSILGAP